MENIKNVSKTKWKNTDNKKVRIKADFFNNGRRVGWRKEKLSGKVFLTTGAVPLLSGSGKPRPRTLRNKRREPVKQGGKTEPVVTEAN